METKDEIDLNVSKETIEYQNKIKQSIEKLKEAFRQIDKNSDDNISQQELLEFLDSQLDNKKKFDRNIFQKIFKSLDLDNNGTISV